MTGIGTTPDVQKFCLQVSNVPKAVVTEPDSIRNTFEPLQTYNER